MNPVLAVSIGVLVVQIALLAAQLAHLKWGRDGALDSRMRHGVIVTLKTGESFSGVLFERDALCLVLRNAVDLQPNAPVPIDGELLVLWAEVAYFQKP